jgi:hypothetical protein
MNLSSLDLRYARASAVRRLVMHRLEQPPHPPATPVPHPGVRWQRLPGTARTPERARPRSARVQLHNSPRASARQVRHTSAVQHRDGASREVRRELHEVPCSRGSASARLGAGLLPAAKNPSATSIQGNQSLRSDFCSLLRASQIFSVPSVPLLMMRLPSGLWVTLLIPLGCALSVNVS